MSGDDSCSLATLAEKERDRTLSRGRTARFGTRRVANGHKSSEHGLIVVDRGGGGLVTGARHGSRVAQVEADREAIQEGHKAPAVLSDQPEVAVRLAWDLRMSRELAITATLAMSSPELTHRQRKSL